MKLRAFIREIVPPTADSPPVVCLGVVQSGNEPVEDVLTLRSSDIQYHPASEAPDRPRVDWVEIPGMGGGYGVGDEITVELSMPPGSSV